MDELIAGTMAQILAREARPETVRALWVGQDGGRLWQAFEEAGLPDALLPEEEGGSGLSLGDLQEILFALGRHAVPLPLGETMLVRALLGAHAPQGRIAIAINGVETASGIECRRVAVGRSADWVITALAAGTTMLPVAAAFEFTDSSSVPGSDADLRWSPNPAGARRLTAELPWLAAGALVTAALMAGAIDRILELVVDHAKTRTQFGRSIGKFQAVQQQIAVLTEQAAVARAASEFACTPNPSETIFDPTRAAIAKIRVGEAAITASAIGHAVLGAIGVTVEHELHLHTRLLQHGRTVFGGEGYWARHVGSAIIQKSATDMLSFVRPELGTEL